MVVAEADTLFVGAPHTQRVLKRRLTALQELAQYQTFRMQRARIVCGT